MIIEGKGNKAIIMKLANTEEDADRGVHQGLHRVLDKNVKHSRQLIYKGPKTGRLYRIKGRKRLHRASAPGEAPANMFGNLAKSIGYNISGVEGSFASKGDISGPPVQASGVSYGMWLNDGTKKMAARPHMSRTVKENEAIDDSVMQDEVSKQIEA